MCAVQSNTDLGRFGSAAIPNAASRSPSVEELVAFERMLADLSARMANVPADRVEAEMQLAQAILRQFLGFDRSTFAEFQDDGSLVVLSSTAVEGVEATPLGPLPTQLAWFIAKLRAGETLVIQDPANDLPPEAVGEAEYFQRTGLHSHLSIPLRIGGRVVGAIAFAAFRETRTWPDDLIARVKLVGEVFAHAIARKREQEKLLAAMAEIKAPEGPPRAREFLFEAGRAGQAAARTYQPLAALSCRWSRKSSRWRKPVRRFCCWAKPEAERRSWPRRSTMRAPEKIDR